MKSKHFALILVALLIAQVILSYSFLPNVQAKASPDVFVGVDIAYGDVAEAKALIDQVSSYTNLIVIGTTNITWYPDKLNETFQYAYDKGLSFISLTPSIPQTSIPGYSSVNRTEWFEYAKEAWGNRLLGFYENDEPGGKVLDRVNPIINRSVSVNNFNPITDNGSVSINSYADAANLFVNSLGNDLSYARTDMLDSSSYPLFTSDYALYWFDYKAGYNTVFAEFGWNYSRQLNVALCRGAATAQNKDWGAIITWTYTSPPYIESGKDLYNDMVLAYDNGAKYIVVFDANDGWTSGILQPEQLEAMQQFWQYVQDNPRKSSPISDRTAYVLPNSYGYGFRGPQDHIWGIWEADELSYNLSVSIGSLLNEYGTKLDIIYDDGLQPNSTLGYSQLLYWNSYTPPPSPPPSPSPSPSAPPTSTPDAPTYTFPTTWVVAAVATLAAAIAGFLVYFKKYRR